MLCSVFLVFFFLFPRLRLLLFGRRTLRAGSSLSDRYVYRRRVLSLSHTCPLGYVNACLGDKDLDTGSFIDTILGHGELDHLIISVL